MVAEENKSVSIPSDKIKERVLLLRRFLYHIEWDWPNEVKTRVLEFLGRTQDKFVNLEELAKSLTDAQLERLIWLSPVKDYYTFRGKYYTVRKGGVFEPHGSWEEVKNDVKQILKIHGKKGYALLKALTEINEAPFELITAKASEIYGDRIYPSHLIAELRDKWDLAWEVGSGGYPKWSMPEEVKPAVLEVLAEFEEKPIPVLRTKDSEQEFLEVIKMEEEFKNYLSNLIKERLEETVEFGRKWSPQSLIDYLQDLYGPVIFFDHLLSITQQYSICDAEVINEDGNRALNIGFNLALFGEPGTGKTFATKDMILGNESQNVPPHGLPGLNRYCGGMTPAKFIAIGEAYQGRKFNFIVTEFNDWFKYKGMVEPLKLAMERGTIRYETKTYTVGPYKFSSFFSVNYNTRVFERGYEATVSDPNFNAIEDRMLCRLHRLTKEKYGELAKSQRKLMLGILQSKMAKVAPKLRDHLTLVYAIQTKHPLVVGAFQEKKVLLTNEMLELIDRASSLILEHLETRTVPFSMRLEKRAIQLASAMTLANYFNVDSDLIPIDSTAAKMATQFFVEEAWVRANEAFPLYEVLKKLALGDQKGTLEEYI
ncbi:hypothetical protein [Candidatus Methanodesulfokora washburnensis]|jgi:hypothetical protein|uniref:Uncharacterized protein n=1 Tax=Candidatus Methanodesulfokora washburnensis TaxID=2478471 RepID=A0A429GWQ8_9CREN|nr:hypothetical protein [Candidatus Methanodesulfokores washburnensis]RSN78395.1 hypothetical protein D6D85_01015 [Candidatus Methanodesulfokores washburnensis]